MGNFKKDRLAGEAGERRVAKTLIVTENAKKVDHTQSGKDYDFTLVYPDDSAETYEVKSDFKASTTGNIFFEYSCNSELSGLSATKANKWAVLLLHLNEILVFEPNKMWEYLQSSSHRQTKGGDGYRVMGYIVPIEAIKELSFVRSVPEIKG